MPSNNKFYPVCFSYFQTVISPAFKFCQPLHIAFLRVAAWCSKLQNVCHSMCSNAHMWLRDERARQQRHCQRISLWRRGVLLNGRKSFLPSSVHVVRRPIQGTTRRTDVHVFIVLPNKLAAAATTTCTDKLWCMGVIYIIASARHVCEPHFVGRSPPQTNVCLLCVYFIVVVHKHIKLIILLRQVQLRI